MNKILMSITITSLLVSFAWAKPQNQIDTKSALEKHISQIKDPETHVALARFLVTNKVKSPLDNKQLTGDQIKFYNFISENSKTEADKKLMAKYLESLSSKKSHFIFLAFVLAHFDGKMTGDPYFEPEISEGTVSTTLKAHSTPGPISRFSTYIKNQALEGYVALKQSVYRAANK